MSPEIVYFLKVNVALALFYVFYRLFFQKDTFFLLRRLMLLLCFAVAVLYPLPDMQEWVKEQKPVAEFIRMYSSLLPEGEAPAETPADAGSGTDMFLRVVSACYAAGVALLLLHFLVQSGRILWLTLNSRSLRIRGTKVYVLDRPAGPFSFFGMIFLHPDSHSERETDEILAHERAHVSQWHSVDVLAGEWMCILCWMNPFVWLLRREVRCNLEYLADRSVLASGFDSRIYQYHLLGQACHCLEATAGLYNNFNVLHLKNRIRMMNKRRSRAIERTKYLMFLPLAALLMLLANVEAVARIAGSVPEPAAAPEAVQPELPQDGKKVIFTVVEEMPQFPGGDSELLKFLDKNIQYPAEAKAKGIKGRVIVSFIVNEDGRISDPQITRGAEASLDAEALRIIRTMPVWTPGKQRGKNVAVKYTVPISFRIQ
ncbi:MAG: M56 family metallopeptidase [Tannerellaceae bacterium]|jgi:TonB family protein|nr:M56 family metallopeptidase [Tannerellaceae bacterium]